MKNQIKINTQTQFDLFVNEKVNELFENFKKVYKKKKYPENFKSIELAKLRAKQVEYFEHPKFSKVFTAVNNIVNNSNIEETYFDAITKYCKKNRIKNSNEIIDYLLNLRIILIVFDKIRVFQLNKQNENEVLIANDQPILDKKNEYTIARQVIAIKFILDELNIKQIDQTVIARFIHFLTRGELIKTNIQNTNTYKKLLSSNNFNKQDINDLLPIRDIFEKLGLYSIMEKIDKEIKKIENLG